MIYLEESIMIHILYKQGMSKKAIARKLGMSINTVRKYLRSVAEPRYSSRPGQVSKLDIYKDYIEKRLKDAFPHWVPGTVIYREITEYGYEGCYSLLTAYMHTLKNKIEEPIVRFETEPGYQMQVDWAKMRLGKDKLSAFIATLGYSRASYVEFVTDEKLDTLIACHQHAFDYFGGIPKTILYDNMKTVIIERNSYGDGVHCFQAGFWDFAKHMGFCPRVCRPYRAQTKGKVERFIHYLKYSFYFPLVGQLKTQGIVLDKDSANYYVKKWLNETANQRLHATTHAVPFERLVEEQPKLLTLPLEYQRIAHHQIDTEASLQRSYIIDTFDANPIQHELSLYQQILEHTGVIA